MRGSYEELNTPAKAGTPNPAGLVWNAWAKGHKMGLISNSDHQSTHQSYACVYAPELTAEAVMRAHVRGAWKARRVMILQEPEAEVGGRGVALGTVQGRQG